MFIYFFPIKANTTMTIPTKIPTRITLRIKNNYIYIYKFFFLSALLAYIVAYWWNKLRTSILTWMGTEAELAI